jgi:hypothetical protein
MLLTFFDISGLVHYKFVPTGETVNQVYYIEAHGNGPKFSQHLMDLASRQCTCSHDTVCEGVFS